MQIFGQKRPEKSKQVSKIVYAKIDYLLANGIEITNRFDLANATADPEYTKYVYDPTAITTTNDCLNKTHHKCIEAWHTVMKLVKGRI